MMDFLLYGKDFGLVGFEWPHVITFHIIKFPLVHIYIYRGGSPPSNPYFRAKPKLSVLKIDSLADTFFWTKNFQKNVKCYWEKFWKFFWHSKKKCFQDTFFEKKNLEIFLSSKSFSKFFLNFFSKKVSWKNIFFSVKKLFKTFSHNISHFFENF